MLRRSVQGVFFVTLLSALSLLAQTPTATLVGTVYDSSGAVVPGAALEVKNSDTNETRKTVTSERGEFTVPNLMPGRYEVTTMKEGFHTRRETDIELELDQKARMEIRLEVGASSQTVEVAAVSAPLINTENATKGEVMTAAEIVQMPLDGHDFNDLALLVPGVLPNQPGVGGGPWTANGSRPDGNNILIDGFNNMNPRNGAAYAQPNLEALAEFKLQTSSYSAEYGRQGGGVMTMALKTGGNRVHGALFEFLRNDAFDARNFFDQGKAKLRRNQFGAEVSGPVLIPKVYNGRDHTFFMFSWESFRQTQGQSRLGLVPTGAQKAGDFSGGALIKDPLLTGACTAANGAACFPDNKIPLSRINPISLKIQTFFPEPNLPGQVNNYYSYANLPNSWDSYVAKIDERISDKDALSFRFSTRYNRSENAFQGSPNMAGFGAATRSTAYLAGLTYTRMFTPAMSNEARISVARNPLNVRGVHQGHDYAAEFGLPSPADPNFATFPSVAISGWNTLGDATNLPRTLNDTSYHAGDTMTWVKGTHLLKFGAEYLHTMFNQPTYNFAGGQYSFAGFWTNNAYADFLLGYLNTDQRVFQGTTTYLRQTSFGFFAQDDWKVSNRLTLNLGLRYDVTRPFYEKYGRSANFVPGLNMVVVGTQAALDSTGLTFPANLVTTAEKAGLPAVADTNYSDMAPRLGFAWRPFGGNRTVLRGGYGIYFTGFQLNTLTNSFAISYPFVQSQSFSRSPSPTVLTLSTPFPSPLSSVATRANFNLNGYEVHQSTPYLQSWNLTVERQFGSNAIEVSYFGSKGTHLNLYNNINQPSPGTGFQPYAGLGAINYYFFEANSIYNAGSVTLRRRFTRGFFYSLNYVYSKTIDEASQSAGISNGGSNGLQNVRCLRCDRGRADWDIPHAFTMSFSWLSPFHNRLIHGWQLAGSGRLYSGFGFTPRLSKAPAGTVRPDRIAKGTVENPTVDRWFDIAAFPANAAGRYGTSGRNVIDAPGKVSVNLNLSKNFKISEQHNLQFRWEVFNFMNRANFGLPVRDVDVPNAATITTADPGRSMQFGLRYSF
jgi:Carboxypeptidase regulatory-like domain/TonB-dependent Receptor Plug Domain